MNEWLVELVILSLAPERTRFVLCESMTHLVYTVISVGFLSAIAIDAQTMYYTTCISRPQPDSFLLSMLGFVQSLVEDAFGFSKVKLFKLNTHFGFFCYFHYYYFGYGLVGTSRMSNIKLISYK